MIDRPPPHLVSAARAILDVLDAARIPACLIGGMVISRWGQPRATSDADLSVFAPYGQEGPVLDALLAHFQGRRRDARTFAVESRVLLLRTLDNIQIDVALAAFPFEFEVIERSTDWPIGRGIHLRTCSAEDLVIYKLVAARPQDLVDVQGIVRRQGDRLELDRIRRWGRAFAELKEDPDLLTPFENALRKSRQD